MMMRKRQIHRHERVEDAVQTILILVLIALIFFMMWNVRQIQGTARVVNYAGILRGGTQRLVKLEMTGSEQSELRAHLNDIIYGLRDGDVDLNLVALKDTDYQEKLETQITYWEQLKHEIAKAEENGTVEIPTACVMFDLNGLKHVNDTLGHLAGDTLIANFANILRTAIPASEFVGRYGGDEFIAVFENTDRECVQKILDDVRAAIGEFNQHSEQIMLSYACGYAISTDYQECSLKTLLEKADFNMYINKRKMKGILDDKTDKTSLL